MSAVELLDTRSSGCDREWRDRRLVRQLRRMRNAAARTCDEAAAIHAVEGGS